MDETAVRRPVPRVAYPIALGLACVALFWGTATLYYHFSRLGTAVEDSAIRHAIVAVHDFLGVWGVVALTAFPFLWPVIFFFREQIGGLQLKTFGWLCAAGFASILAGLLGGPISGGTFGAIVGGKLHAALGQGLSLVLCLAAMGMALFLATERFFSLPAKPTFDLSAARGIGTQFAAGIAAPALTLDTSLRVEESKEISQVERFDLEKVLEIEKEETVESVIEEPISAPAPIPVAEAPAPRPTPAEPVSISEPEPAIVPPPPPPSPEEKAVELEEAVERATKDFVLPPPPAIPAPDPVTEPIPAAVAEEPKPAPAAPAPAVVPPAAEPSASPGMLDNAARLVVQEGRASVSLLQRRLSIPFSRASLLLDLLEREGVIGPYRGGPSRDILLSLADWEQKQKSASPDPALPQA